MGEQWWRPVVALFVVGATLFLTMLLGFGAAVAFSGAIGFAAGEPNPGAGIVLAVLAVVVLVGGLWLAARVGSGGPGGGMVGGFTWQVSEPGAHLRLSPGGKESVWLPPGATVKEVGERHLGFISVITLGGETGWLDRRQVQPPTEEPTPPA